MVMTSQEKVSNITKKNLFCRDTYWKLINQVYGKEVFSSIPGARLRNCTYGDNCRGAHCEEEINLLPHIKAFEYKDKSKLDLVSIYLNIKNVFASSKQVILNPLYIEKLEIYDELNFIELLNLWFEITCYHRKLKKEMKKDTSIKSEYSNPDKIPQFELEDEDTVWSLERLTKLCPLNYDLHRKISSKCDSPTIWDMCLASVNCKLGCHNTSYMVCNHDLLTGNCSCISKEEFNDSRQIILDEIEELKEEVKEEITAKKRKAYLRKRINKLYKDYENINRKIHLTENGLIPFEVQLNNYNKKKEELLRNEERFKKDRVETMKSTVKKKIVKPIF